MNDNKENIHIARKLAFGFMFIAGIIAFLYIIYFNWSSKENAIKTSNQITSISQYLANAVEIKKENKDFNIKEINNLNSNLINNENVIKGRTNNIQIIDNKGKLSIFSSNYTKVFCDNLINLNKRSLNYKNFDEKELNNYKNLIKKYNVKINGDLLTNNKVMCRDNFAKNGNILIISEK
mgnify:CR=1 FL=1